MDARKLPNPSGASLPGMHDAESTGRSASTFQSIVFGQPAPFNNDGARILMIQFILPLALMILMVSDGFARRWRPARSRPSLRRASARRAAKNDTCRPRSSARQRIRPCAAFPRSGRYRRATIPRNRRGQGSAAASTGRCRTGCRDGFDSPAQIEPDKPYLYEIKLNPTGILFKTGQRIRLSVSSSDFPNFDRNHNTGRDYWSDPELRVAHQTIFHAGDRRSCLILPVIPR